MYAVRCPQCVYRAELFVGTGMRSTLGAFSCPHCRELVSVPVAIRDEGTFEVRNEAPRCPDCGAAEIVAWPPDRRADGTVSEDEDNPPLGPCPDCGVQMEEEGIRGLWD